MIAQKPPIGPESSVPVLAHYHGDIVRLIMLTIVALLLLAAPFYSGFLKAELPFEIAAAIVLAGLAAMTSPRSGSVIVVDALISALGLIIFGMWGVLGFANGNSLAFAVRITIALLFLCAFYYSVKTSRALAVHPMSENTEEANENVLEKIIEDIEMIPRDKDMAHEIEEIQQEGGRLEEIEDIQEIQQKTGD